MDYKIIMPRLSDSMDEGQLIEWKIRPGDSVKKGDVVAEVESDKAVMEIQSFKSGIVRKILVEPGTTVAVGTPMAVIETDTATVASRTVDTAKSNTELRRGPNHKESEMEQKHSEEASGETRKTKPSKSLETNEAANIGRNASQQSPLDIIVGMGETATLGKHSYTGGNSSPRARAEAAKYGLNIEKLQEEKKLPIPTHMADIKRYRLRRYFTPRALELMARYHISDELFDAGKKHGEKEIFEYIQTHEIPLPQLLGTMQKSMIAVVEEAARRPVYHMSDHIDTTLLKYHETKELTITVWLLKLFAEAMMQQEYFRMSLLDGSIQIWPNASISLAVASGDYLYMPVFRDLNKKTPVQISKELQKLKRKIEERKLTKKDLSGSTFGISNLGMTGIEQFDAMINKKDCAIAAIGSETEDRITITLTVDHRIVNGYQAALFMQELKALAKDAMFFKGAVQ
ncbi:CatA-like O-acetyltransferase [Sulfurovum sp.]|uniref:2-oxo acid dehydrogenase subunit E2 n=1 Tax=Sulfurovum sp. TaxID=1969726 RepID=UPI0025F837F4|nr:CatA-like O-acetyltransferase [Sulfurovum sp.]